VGAAWAAMVITELSCFALGITLQGIRRIFFLLVMALQVLSTPPCVEVEALNLGHLKNSPNKRTVASGETCFDEVTRA